MDSWIALPWGAVTPEINTKHTTAVEVVVQGIYRELFPGGSRSFVPTAFSWANDFFTGHYGEYQPIDARYHDFEHTMQGVLCMARILRGYHRAKATPALTSRAFELGLLAILMHDTGYLKVSGDLDGTGAKYTLVHVNRSVEFAGGFLSARSFSGSETKAVQNMIRCTGVNVDLKAIPFQDELERKVGFALGTADLLGQMAAPDYIDKLPVLFLEFAEAARFSTGNPEATGMFKSARDLMEKTPTFWEKYVLPKIVGDFGGMHRYLNAPFPDGANSYIKQIEAHIERLREVTARPAVNA